MLLKLEHIKKQFHDPNGDPVTILEEVHLEVNRGQFVALLGPSGCGKTTLLNLIGGLLKPDGGQIFFDGKEMTNLTPREADHLRNRQIGFIFQGSHLLPTLTVLENVLLPLTFFKGSHRNAAEKRKRALAALDELGLGDRVHYHPHQLSLGQRRRVAIARALINEPELIIADEPTADLDSTRVTRVIGILQNLNAQGKTLLVSTHQQEVADAAEVRYGMEKGRLVVKGN